QIVHLADPSLRNAFDECAARLGLEEFTIDVGGEITRCDAVDSDGIPRKFERHVARELCQSRFRCRVRHDRTGLPKTQDGFDVDDAAGTWRLTHPTGDGGSD